MHPTDTLLSLSHARIARAAVAGPRRATQPTAMSNAQRLAQREQVWLRTHYTAGQPVKLPASQAGCDQWTTYRFSGTILQLRAASDADSGLAQQIDAL